MENISFDFRGGKGTGVTCCQDLLDSLLQRVGSIRVLNIDGISISIGYIPGNNGNNIVILHRCMDGFICCLCGCGIPIGIGYVPARKDVAHLVRIVLREGDIFSIVICSGKQHLFVGIPENDHGGVAIVFHFGIIGHDLCIARKDEGIILFRRENISRCINPIQESLRFIQIGKEHSFTGVILSDGHVALYSTVIHHVEGSMYRQLESRPGSNLKQSYQAGIIRNTERIALLVAQLILKGTIISVVPANKMIFRTGIGNDCDVVTIEIRTTTGQSADRIV